VQKSYVVKVNKSVERELCGKELSEKELCAKELCGKSEQKCGKRIKWKKIR